ncbi:hypothetical protein BX616_006850, partial [Lobosporangium transversale]
MMPLPGTTPVGHPPTLAEAEAPSQALLSQLKESLIQADANRQQCLNEKMKLAVKYNTTIINPAFPPDEAEAAKLEFEQMNKNFTDKLETAEAHYQMIKGLINTQEAMNKSRQPAATLHEDQSLPETETQDSNGLDVFPVIGIKKHVALARVFNYKRIPIIDKASMEIDYSRVQIQEKSGAPSLRFQLKGIPLKDVPFKVIKTVVDFQKSFKTHYTNYLTDDLFDDMAWRYMNLALVPTGLHEEYDRLIKTPVYQNRSWHQVKRCIQKILKFDLIRSLIISQIGDLAPMSGEDANSYVDRIELLIEAGGLQLMGVLLYGKITSTLSDAGREKVLSEFHSLDTITDVNQLLEFIRMNPSVLSGERRNPCAWFINKFGNELSPTKNAEDNQPKEVQQHRRQSRTHSKRVESCHPYHTGKRAQRVGNSNPCKDPTCVSLNRKHSDADCFRHTNPNKFAELNKQAHGRDKKGPIQYKKVASLRQMKEDSFDDVLGNDLELAINRMDIWPYVESPTGISLKEHKHSSLI